MNNPEIGAATSKPGIIERLRSQHDGMLPKGEYAFVTKKDIAELMTAIDGIRIERDEVRRMYCKMTSRDNVESARYIADRHGWDCFKEDGNA